MTKSTTRRFLCCLLALCCLLGSLTAFSLAAGTSYPYSASVNADTNLRRSPSSAESNIIARIPKGTILTVTGASGNFLCVTYDGQVGYIFKQYAEQVTTNTSESGSVAYGFPYYTTTKSSVNLRTTRSTTSARVTTIPKGATVIIHGVSGDWAQVTYQEKTGYCMTAYLKLLTVVEPTAAPTAVPTSAPILEDSTYKVLQNGSTGNQVLALQQALAELGYLTSTPDGTYNTTTMQAVIALQKMNSLPMNGIADANLQALIFHGQPKNSSGTKVSIKTLPALSGITIRLHDQGVLVSTVQTRLTQLGYYDGEISGVYDVATQTAVKAFQKSEGLAQDGVVGQTTWQELYAEWVNAQSDAGGTAYPGTALHTGSRGNAVRLVQFWLRLAAENYTGLSNVTVDGSFGSGTASAVRAFQRLFGLTADGVVGAGTWAKLNEVGLAVANNLVGQNIQPGQFVTTLREGSTGTPVRALQYNLRLLAAYYRDVPTVTVDGTFGAATRRAVIAWQEHAGLTVDGVVGRLTWQSIYDSAQQVSASGPAVTARAPDTPEETLKVGDSGQKIRILSQILEFLAQFLPEITPSGLTDTFDDALETTVRSAQQTLGRTVTGEVTPADWLAFYRAALSLGAVNPASAAPEPQEVWPGAALTLGSSGPAVLQVQQWLNEIAAQDCSASFVPETGEFDTATQTALEAWQIANNITPLGVVDDSVWKQLKADANIS